ncbi:MAG TPA: hypothetical protein VK968_15440 [Roseimicrobium sp.]|nr:hypothetical protein [Roseimicrobium sp.]
MAGAFNLTLDNGGNGNMSVGAVNLGAAGTISNIGSETSLIALV